MRDQRIPLFFICLFFGIALALASGFGDADDKEEINNAATHLKKTKTSEQFNLPFRAEK
jgi:hypothetical protein